MAGTAAAAGDSGSVIIKQGRRRRRRDRERRWVRLIVRIAGRARRRCGGGTMSGIISVMLVVRYLFFSFHFRFLSFPPSSPPVVLPACMLRCVRDTLAVSACSGPRGPRQTTGSSPAFQFFFPLSYQSYLLIWVFSSNLSFPFRPFHFIFISVFTYDSGLVPPSCSFPFFLSFTPSFRYLVPSLFIFIFITFPRSHPTFLPCRALIFLSLSHTHAAFFWLYPTQVSTSSYMVPTVRTL
jgi:hypothetical protein